MVKVPDPWPLANQKVQTKGKPVSQATVKVSKVGLKTLTIGSGSPGNRRLFEKRAKKPASTEELVILYREAASDYSRDSRLGRSSGGEGEELIVVVSHLFLALGSYCKKLNLRFVAGTTDR